MKLVPSVSVEGLESDKYAVAGEAHWHVLLRARAIETQAYVLAAAQARQPLTNVLPLDVQGTVNDFLDRMYLCSAIKGLLWPYLTCWAGLVCRASVVFVSCRIHSEL